MNEYQLFPDIRLIYRDEKYPIYSGIVLTFCLSGVREYLIDGRYFYLTAGNYILLRNGVNKCSDSSGFSGVTVLIDDTKTPVSTSDMLFDSRNFIGKISGCMPYISKADSDISKLFIEAEKYCESSERVLLRLRIVEALMLISNGMYTTSADKTEKAMTAAELICGDITMHYTIPQLSKRIRLNPTTLKSAFKSTFGCSVYSYAKCRKMFRASELLLNSDMKIIDIAEEVGYCNASKFASAFQSVMSVSPKHYRMEHIRSSSRTKAYAAASASY